jgi:CRP/FNR family transcriptional regulator
MSGVEFPAFAATETKLEAIIVPPEILQRWVSQHKVWSEYLWGLLSSRLAEVISLVEEVAFQRVDKRTAEYLLHLADADGKITKTHQDIAADLGSSREVISRILKEFEHRGLISLSRGEIHTENLIALQRAAST